MSSLTMTMFFMDAAPARVGGSARNQGTRKVIQW
ncbi:hypothetical protein CLV65_0048 [Pseudoscardovia suis]|uniref:Uncharacterized protein n=1 Tax=Pseudoscardovia suis TaxID=987063 RepID=A0A261EYX3_9BIFI|nr:hypothetical protein PSSU_0834 [Pseudoscardovia suis]PJJ69351.1 hypothetical protein CLV65_0048 [Pseudoscardovia suis]